jgi:thymidylate synthase (FAD)
MIEVAYVTHSGTDLLTANAARRSFDHSHAQWSDAPRGRRGRSDPQLIADLAEDGHLLPFRHCHVTLACTAPLPIARQLGKHQVGFSWSEVSRRYKTKGIALHDIETWRADVPDRRQGSGEALDARTNALLCQVQDRVHAECRRAYDYALTMGASPEQARFLLPQSMDVSWTWTGSLLGWSALVRGRSHPDAQAETREFANRVAEVVAPLFPVSWAALAGWRPEAAGEAA